MIADLFFNTVFWFVNFLVGIFPLSEGFPQEAHTAMVSLAGYFGMFDALIPMGTLLTCLTLIFTIEIAVFGFRSLKWLLSHLPFIGGRG